ncbi:MAG: hypothetical protein FJ011_23670, partial [Chloroflexi bacterium]|nr:hypothetical protein [Chloroflexota bacterium]
LIVVFAYLLSTALSVAPRISFFGSYVRLQGTFTFLSYVTLFLAVLTHLRSQAQVNRLIFTIILSSLPISIYGIIQHYGLDPLPWGGDVKERVAANMGNAIFVAAYLIMAVFLTFERLVDSVAALLSVERGGMADALRAGGYLFVLAVQLVCIVFTQSRGPWLGLAAGLYVFGMLGLLLAGRWAVGRSRAPGWLSRMVRPAWLTLIGLTLLGLVLLGVLNIPQGPLSSLCRQRYVDRICALSHLESGTNAVRVLIWEGAVDMMLKPHPPIEYPDGAADKVNPIRPLVGYGPESMWVAYNRFYPPDLAHYEARNASPDRSHNETFDALVRTGMLGFAAQLFLYGSVFYYALRWLGLVQGRRRRNLFLGLLAGGAATGVVVPLLADHSLRLAGIGLPAGLIVGVVLYVTLDLLLTPPVAQPAQPTDGAEPNPATQGHTAGRRQLLILAVFAAIAAHFVEVHFGIAIASTLTHFWILSAVLVAVGMGWTAPARQDETAPVALVARAAESRAAAGDRRREDAIPAARAGQRGASASASRPAPGAKGARKGKKAEPPPTARQAASGRKRDQRPRGQTAIEPAVRPSAQPSAWVGFLPFAFIAAIITLVLTWDYLVNQTGAATAAGVLWDAFTARVDNATFRVVRQPMLLILMIFTWGVGGLLAISEHARWRAAEGRSDAPAAGTHWPGQAAISLGAGVGVFLVYGLIQASRTSLKGLAGLDVFRHLAGHIVAFDAALLIGIMGLAIALWLADGRPRPPRWFSASPFLPLTGGLIAVALAFAVIMQVNVQIIQADTYYKQGLSYEGAGQWESAAILYREAAQLEPAEDFYYLFLGRALLQLSTTMQAGAASLPADLTGVPTADLLGIVERGLRTRNRDDMLRAAHAALTAAQRLNPLNTDHSANLARLNRSWAFANALGPNEAPTNAALRQLVEAKAPGVDLARLDLSLMHYRQATSLSPQNAQLWNELAAVQFVQGHTQEALATLERSRSLDRQYPQTYLQRADILAATGDKAGALAAYRAAAELTPKDIAVQSAVGVYSAQLGDLEGALTAFRRIIELESAALDLDERQLADLEALVARSGGYSMLLPAATSRRDALRGSIAARSGQLHLMWRNTALVLRDANRLPEALAAARTALTYASEGDKPTLDALIADLQRRSGG